MTLIAIDIGEQALNRALFSSPNAVKTLAAFGIAYMIIKLATGMISEVKLVSIMLVHNHADRRKMSYCVIFAGSVTIAGAVIIGYTKIGIYLIDELHGLPASVGFEARMAILYLSAFPLLDGLAWIHTGILLKYKYSFTVGAASVVDNVVQVGVVAGLLQTNLPSTNAVIIPVLAAYLGTSARLLTVVLAYYTFVHKKLKSSTDQDDMLAVDPKLTLKKIVSFWAPLALVQLCQRICRPIVNLLMARDRLDGTTREMAVEAVAVLSLCYPIGHLPYGWLNTIRSIEPAFRQKLKDNEEKISIKKIRIFNFGCLIFSLTIMAVLFWIPGVAPAILIHVSSANKQLIGNAVNVLRVFSFFPIPVANRANLTGMFISKRQTKYLYPSVPTRIVVLLAMLFILPRCGVHGAIMGVAALISAFIGESLCVLLTAIILKWKKIIRSDEQATTGEAVLVAEDETVM